MQGDVGNEWDFGIFENPQKVPAQIWSLAVTRSRLCQCSTATQAMFHVEKLLKIKELDSLKSVAPALLLDKAPEFNDL